MAIPNFKSNDINIKFCEGINVIMDSCKVKEQKLIHKIHQDELLVPDFNALMLYTVLNKSCANIEKLSPTYQKIYKSIAEEYPEERDLEFFHQKIINDCKLFNGIPNIKHEENLLGSSRMTKLMHVKHLVKQVLLSHQKTKSLGAFDTFFWDAPEADLHPQDMKPVALLLRNIAITGVQIMISTTSYLLMGELSIASEYDMKPKAPIKFFFQYKDKIQDGKTLSDVVNNTVLEAYAEHYHDENEAHLKYYKKRKKEIKI